MNGGDVGYGVLFKEKQIEEVVKKEVGSEVSNESSEQTSEKPSEKPSEQSSSYYIKIILQFQKILNNLIVEKTKPKVELFKFIKEKRVFNQTLLIFCNSNLYL